MKLNEFMETTLTQIVAGVKKAQETTRDQNKTGTEANTINPDIR